MDVRFAKPTQFSPMVLHLPSNISRNGQRRLSSEEPDLWKAYQRLSKTEPAPRVTHCHSDTKPISIPGKEGMRCMCYENLLRIIKERAQIPPPQSFRCPNGRGTKSQLQGVFPSWIRRALDGYHDNKERGFPLSTIVARWQQRRYLPNYDKSTLVHIFSRYGPVREMRPLSTNSCLVIFSEMKGACEAMESRYIGTSINKIHCKWWHKSMANKFVVARAKGLTVETNHFLV